LRWYLDDEFLYGVDARALNLTGAIIPEEPMYLLLNTAISSTWGFPQPCPDGCACDCFDCRKPECECAIPYGMCNNFPAYFLVDYVRVYQAVGDDSQIVGCSTPTHPTSRYIKGHQSKFMSEGDKMPLQPIAQGGADCTEDFECGRGVCERLKCKCETGFEGPHCLVSKVTPIYLVFLLVFINQPPILILIHACLFLHPTVNIISLNSLRRLSVMTTSSGKRTRIKSTSP
jgi:beta-glucan synthesis-associated protein KRE6